MSTVVNTSQAFLGPFSPVKITLATSGDTLTYVPGIGQVMTLFNTSASDVVVTVDGANGTTVPVSGAGALTVSIAAGLAITVTAGNFTKVKLDTIPAYLNGVVAISAATGGVVAAIITQ